MTKTQGSGIGLAVPDPGASLLPVELRNLPVALPKLYVMPIDELPCGLFRDLVVGALKLDCPADMTVLVQNVDPISSHLGPPHASELIETQKAFWVCPVPDSKQN
jgi:hypothetical protein